MTTLRLKRLFLHFIGILLAAAIIAAAGPAWSQEEGVSADVIVSGEPADPREAGLAAENREDDIGFPQLNTRTYSSQVFWLLVSFAALYALMSKVALPRIAEVIDMRETQKNGNLSRAEQLQEEAAKVQAAFEASLAKAQESAQGSLAEAAEKMAETLAAENAKFSEHARKRIVNAEQSIAKAKSDAFASLADISAEIAAEIVHKISDMQITKPDAKKAVLAEMQKG